MWSAEDDYPPTLSERICHGIDMAGVRRVACDADEVSASVEIDPLVVLINQADSVRRSHEARQIGHGQLRKIIELSAPKSFDKGVFGGHKQDVHFSLFPFVQSGRQRRIRSNRNRS